MARPKKQEKITDPVILKTSDERIEAMSLETFEDYLRYNEAARMENKKLRQCRHPAKPIPLELHPTTKMVFGVKNGDRQAVPVKKSDAMIDFSMKMVPGRTYEVPIYIYKMLAAAGQSVWAWKENSDGSRETVVTHKEPRFNLQTVF